MSIKNKRVKKSAPILLKLWPTNRMAEIWHGKTLHFCGNYWDFHPGCHGTHFRIKRKVIDIGKDWHGPEGLAYTIALISKTKLVIKEYKREWKD